MKIIILIKTIIFKYLKRLIFFILIFLNFNNSYANIQICDKWNNIFDYKCENWILINNIDWLSSFSWSYTEFNNTFFWTNTLIKKRNKSTHSINLGYFWTKFSKEKKRKKEKHIIPVWFFWIYKWEKIDFSKFLENKIKFWINNISLLDNNKVIMRKKSNIINYCSTLKKIESINFEIEKNMFNKSLVLKWKLPENIYSIKLLRIKPSKNELILDKNSTNYIEHNILNNYNYSYKIVAFNECSQEASSDIFTYNNTWDVNRYENIDKNLLKSGKLHITISEAINILYNEKYNKQEIRDKLYYLFPDINLEKILNYEDTSLLIANIRWETIITDKNLAFDIFKNFWLFNDHINKKSKINYFDFLEILSKINSKRNFKDYFLSNIDYIFNLTNEKIINDLFYIYNLNNELQYLKKINYNKYLNLKSCFEFNWCNNIDLYIKTKEKINKISLNQINNLWLENLKNVSIKNYLKILFLINWKDRYNSLWINKIDYNNFIGILVKSILYNESDYNLNYLTYNRLNLIQIDLNLKKSINRLLIYWKEIGQIYKINKDNQRLFDLIKNYLLN